MRSPGDRWSSVCQHNWRLDSRASSVHFGGCESYPFHMPRLHTLIHVYADANLFSTSRRAYTPAAVPPLRRRLFVGVNTRAGSVALDKNAAGSRAEKRTARSRFLPISGLSQGYSAPHPPGEFFTLSRHSTLCPLPHCSSMRFIHSASAMATALGFSALFSGAQALESLLVVPALVAW